MREIKFRAWCSTHEEDEMIYDYCFLNKDDNHFWAEDLTNDRPDVDETLDVMQYTGVKDKNGKEIYEGDIISYKHYRAVKRFWSSLEEIPIIEAEVEAQKNDIPFQKSIVIFEDGIFRLKEPFDLTLKDVPKNEKYERNESSHANIETKSWDFEVVGNIHENPELLEDVG